MSALFNIFLLSVRSSSLLPPAGKKDTKVQETKSNNSQVFPTPNENDLKEIVR